MLRANKMNLFLKTNAVAAIIQVYKKQLNIADRLSIKARSRWFLRPPGS